MTQAWPAELPKMFEAQGYNETPPRTTIRTQMDEGPAKVRRLTTAGVRNLSLTMVMTMSQKNRFDDFYLNELMGGAVDFYFYRPGHPEPGRCRILPDPEYSLYGTNPLLWRVSFNLEVLP